MAAEEEQTYLIYLLRLWPVKDSGTLVWRGSLERAHTDERLGFGSLGELCQYLYEQTATLSAAEGETGPKDT